MLLPRKKETLLEENKDPLECIFWRVGSALLDLGRRHTKTVPFVEVKNGVNNWPEFFVSVHCSLRGHP